MYLLISIKYRHQNYSVTSIGNHSSRLQPSPCQLKKSEHLITKNKYLQCIVIDIENISKMACKN